MCISPVKVLDNETGKFNYYPCGHCECCLSAKSAKLSSMCERESKKHLITLFTTLTYSNSNLPLCKIDYSTRSYDDYKKTAVELPFHSRVSNLLKEDTKVSYKHLRIFPCTDRLYDYYGKTIFEEDFVSHEQIEYFNKLIKPFKSNKFNLPNNKFGILHFPDVQLFLKRWRGRARTQYIKENFHKSITKLTKHEKEQVYNQFSRVKVFYAGEYGPKTFRPHYHILLYCDSYSTASAFRKTIHKAWAYGRVDCQYSNGGARDYVSQYVNSTACLPPIYQYNFSRQKSYHSILFGNIQSKEVAKDIRKVRYTDLVKKYYSRDGKLQFAPVSFSFENQLFPKIYRFNKSDYHLLHERYTLYSKLSRKYKCTNVKRLVNKLLHQHCGITYHSFDLSLHYSNDDILYNSKNKFSTLESILTHGRIFQNNCRDYNISSFEMVKLIINYYKNKDYEILKKSYEDLENYALSQNFRPIYFINYYTNLCRDYLTSPNEDVFKYMSDQLGVEYEDLVHLSRNPHENVVLQDKFISIINIMQSKIKHKIQNDLNKIFL